LKFAFLSHVGAIGACLFSSFSNSGCFPKYIGVFHLVGSSSFLLDVRNSKNPMLLFPAVPTVISLINSPSSRTNKSGYLSNFLQFLATCSPESK